MIDLKRVKIGCIGTGTMGGALIKAICKQTDPRNITVSAAHFEKAQAFAEKNGCNAVESNAEVAKKSQYIFVAVKPQYVRSVLKETAAYVKDSTVIISMAAGVTLEQLSQVFVSETSKIPTIIRIMPNMPASVDEAMIALCCNEVISSDALETVSRLLESAGKVEKVDEKLMDCVTAVSGSGPAYVFMFIEALADAAVRFGMPRSQAYIYAAQTMKGAACMVLEDGRTPAELKDAVCSPAGTTIEGVAALEKLGFRNAVIEAATAAFNKSVSMSKK